MAAACRVSTKSQIPSTPRVLVCEVINLINTVEVVYHSVEDLDPFLVGIMCRYGQSLIMLSLFLVERDPTHEIEGTSLPHILYHTANCASSLISR